MQQTRKPGPVPTRPAQLHAHATHQAAVLRGAAAAPSTPLYHKAQQARDSTHSTHGNTHSPRLEKVDT